MRPDHVRAALVVVDIENGFANERSQHVVPRVVNLVSVARLPARWSNRLQAANRLLPTAIPR
jgi:hypothetical protein